MKDHLKAVTDEKIVVIERVFFASVCMLVRQLNSEKRGRRRKTKMKCKKRANKTKKKSKRNATWKKTHPYKNAAREEQE